MLKRREHSQSRKVKLPPKTGNVPAPPHSRPRVLRRVTGEPATLKKDRMSRMKSCSIEFLREIVENYSSKTAELFENFRQVHCELEREFTGKLEEKKQKSLLIQRDQQRSLQVLDEMHDHLREIKDKLERQRSVKKETQVERERLKAELLEATGQPMCRTESPQPLCRCCVM